MVCDQERSAEVHRTLTTVKLEVADEWLMTQIIALIITHITIYEVMILETYPSSKMFSLCVKNMCLVRNRSEYFNTIEDIVCL